MPIKPKRNMLDKHMWLNYETPAGHVKCLRGRAKPGDAATYSSPGGILNCPGAALGIAKEHGQLEVRLRYCPSTGTYKPSEKTTILPLQVPLKKIKKELPPVGTIPPEGILRPI